MGDMNRRLPSANGKNTGLKFFWGQNRMEGREASPLVHLCACALLALLSAVNFFTLIGGKKKKMEECENASRAPTFVYIFYSRL